MKLAVKEVKFYGHLLTTEGVKVDEEKVEALKNMRSPMDIQETQKFLGMTNYLSKFIPNHSKLTEPLREMVKSKTFTWKERESNSFGIIKKVLADISVLKYYDSTEKIVIQTDGSRQGLGAVMLQNNQPIMFASKSLTATEKNYSQCEIELLAIVYACLRFVQYINGRDNTTIQTDHISLTQIFNKPIHKCTKRIQRLRLKLQKYDLKISFIPGKDLVIADLLSRLPVETTREQVLDETEKVLQINKFLRSVEKINPMSNEEIDDKQIREIREETQKDPVLKKVVVEVCNDWKSNLDDNEVRTYQSVKKELLVKSGILLKGDRFVIPHSLRDKYLDIIHLGHTGIQSCIEKSRRTIFWPGITADIKQKIKYCLICASHGESQQKLPMLTQEIPVYPFQRVSMDFCVTIYKGKKRNILVTVDHYSDFFEINFLKTTTADDVILACKTNFARYGIPKKVVTDGAHNFNNEKFLEFAETYNFTYLNSSPYYPRGNGKAEATVKIVKRIIKKCEDAGQCLWQALLEYRNTPNVIGYSPAQRLMSRNLRSCLPRMDQNLLPSIPANVTENIMQRRASSKANYDKNSKQLSDLEVGSEVMVKLKPDDSKCLRGQVSKQVSTRAYELVINGKKYTRNRQYIRPVYESVKHHRDTQNEVVPSTKTNQKRDMTPPSMDVQPMPVTTDHHTSSTLEGQKTQSTSVEQPAETDSTPCQERPQRKRKVPRYLDNYVGPF